MKLSQLLEQQRPNKFDQRLMEVATAVHLWAYTSVGESNNDHPKNRVARQILQRQIIGPLLPGTTYQGKMYRFLILRSDSSEQVTPKEIQQHSGDDLLAFAKTREGMEALADGSDIDHGQGSGNFVHWIQLEQTGSGFDVAEFGKLLSSHASDNKVVSSYLQRARIDPTTLDRDQVGEIIGRIGQTINIIDYSIQRSPH